MVQIKPQVPHDTQELLDPHKLEDAMPTLINKLRELQQELSPAEKKVFDEIINSAARHTDSVVSAQYKGAQFTKPISAAATLRMKHQMIDLPKTLSIEE
jgi:hypothetical protein